MPLIQTNSDETPINLSAQGPQIQQDHVTLAAGESNPTDLIAKSGLTAYEVVALQNDLTTRNAAYIGILNGFWNSLDKLDPSVVEMHYSSITEPSFEISAWLTVIKQYADLLRKVKLTGDKRLKRLNNELLDNFCRDFEEVLTGTQQKIPELDIPNELVIQENYLQMMIRLAMANRFIKHLRPTFAIQAHRCKTQISPLQNHYFKTELEKLAFYQHNAPWMITIRRIKHLTKYLNDYPKFKKLGIFLDVDNFSIRYGGFETTLQNGKVQIQVERSDRGLGELTHFWPGQLRRPLTISAQNPRYTDFSVKAFCDANGKLFHKNSPKRFDYRQHIADIAIAALAKKDPTAVDDLVRYIADYIPPQEAELIVQKENNQLNERAATTKAAAPPNP